jgi:inosose dehydratase
MSMRVASAPVSWGIMENIPLPEDYSADRVLDEIAEAGYSGTELGPYGFLPTSASGLRAALAKRKLTLCSAFIEMDLGDATKLEAGMATVLTSARLISEAGATLLVLSDEITPARNAAAGRPEIGNTLGWSKQEWKNVKVAVGRVIEECRALGLRVAFHHHVGTHVETPQEVDRLFSLFPASDLGLCLDTGHYVYGGGDVLAYLEKHVSRVWCVHLKDIYTSQLSEARHKKLSFHDAVRHGIFAPLGKGNIDFSRVLSLLKRGDFDGWLVVEADVLPGGVGADAPLPNALAARELLREHGL